MDNRGCVHLILYAGDDVWNEPLLNTVAMFAQGSKYAHVEIAIGSQAGQNGEMKNVARIFNDSTGVELTQRTGINPRNCYIGLGCSKSAETRMLNYARSVVGKPFSSVAMARSVFYPRITDGSSFFCAELVASILKVGGLINPQYNPGSATPESLYQLFKPCASVAANPFTLRKVSAQLGDLRSSEITLRGLAAPRRAARAKSAPPRRIPHDVRSVKLLR